MLILYKLSNHVVGVESQSRVSGGNQNHDPHANSLVHYPLEYKGTQYLKITYNN